MTDSVDRLARLQRIDFLSKLLGDPDFRHMHLDARDELLQLLKEN
jgi:hypothetical protein